MKHFIKIITWNDNSGVYSDITPDLLTLSYSCHVPHHQVFGCAVQWRIPWEGKVTAGTHLVHRGREM